MRTYQEVREWYKNHETEAQLGFYPNGMCLKICRLAAGLPWVAPSAFVAQNMTPKDRRITDISKIQPGHIIYFDDPTDSNPFGHIVTCVGRVKDEDQNKLSSVLCRTNSVVNGKVVVVRGDYFPTYWRDDFVFATDWLGGYTLDVKSVKSQKRKPQPLLGIKDLREAKANLGEAIEKLEEAGRKKRANILKKDYTRVTNRINRMVQRHEKLSSNK